MVHRKRIKCCRATPSCKNCPLLELRRNQKPRHPKTDDASSPTRRR
ncbi:hypothetical protein [Tersicoccus phoenicis]|nr:hypothetical protein [Tersicoccus phoenicis]